MSRRLEALGPHHDLHGFRCGTPTLDDWLQRHADAATGQGTRTYVLVTASNDEVAGYFVIAPHLLQREQAPRSIGRGAPARIPAILLAKLALDERPTARQGLGSELLVTRS